MTTPPPGTEPTVGPPPAFDPECAVALGRLPAFPAVSLDSLPAIRQPPPGFEPPTDEELSRAGKFVIEHHHAPGPAPRSRVPLLVCRPAGELTARPALYYIHGGGMISGDNRMNLRQLLDWAQNLQLVVISVDYRLAPETPHPGPVEDCYAGLSWTAQHAHQLGIDPNRIVLVGESAGGGLAAALALLTRDRGGPSPAGQLLMAPMLDDRNETPSVIQMADIDTWNRARNAVGWTALLGASRGAADVPPYAAPARASDLAGLPATFLDVGSAETFRDEVVDFAVRLWRCGGDAELHVWPGGFHGYDLIAPEAGISRDARAARQRWLARLLGTLTH